MVVRPRPNSVVSPTQSKPWWNRPLFGEKSMVDRLKLLFLRRVVVEEAAELHSKTFTQLQSVTERVNSLDLAKFGNTEFLAFIRLARMFQLGEGEYAQLKAPLALLNAGLTAHHSFTNIEQIEFTHRGRRFNEFYAFVGYLCAQRLPPETFCQQVKAKSVEVYSLLKSTEGKEALRRYALHLERIGQHDLSLNLLYAFKRLQFRSYNVFCVVSGVMRRLKRSDLLNLDILSTQIIQEFESFDTLGPLIGLTPAQQSVRTYSLLLQYLALSDRHLRSYEQFKGLVSQLRRWEELRITLIKVRQQYPISQYKVPKQFLAKIPGLQVYEKYAPYFVEEDLL